MRDRDTQEKQEERGPPTARHAEQLVEQEALAGAVGPDDDDGRDGVRDAPQCRQPARVHLQLGVALHRVHQREAVSERCGGGVGGGTCASGRLDRRLQAIGGLAVRRCVSRASRTSSRAGHMPRGGSGERGRFRARTPEPDW